MTTKIHKASKDMDIAWASFNEKRNMTSDI